MCKLACRRAGELYHPYPVRRRNSQGPSRLSTFFTVAASTPRRSVKGLRFGASETIAPTFRSLLAQPSRRFPMPGANESSTVE